VELTELQISMVLGVCPAGSRIVSAEHFRREFLPAPIRVTTRTPDGDARSFVVRLARHGSVEDEARLLGVLASLGLPVPEVLDGPEVDRELSGHPQIALYSLLPGIDLQKLSERSTEDCQTAAKLVVDAATTLAELTSKLRSEPAADHLSTVGLTGELNRIVKDGGLWLQSEMFLDAVERLRPLLAEVLEEPVFTGGDNQAGNFLTDGTRVTGFVDFEMAGYRDFLLGFAKYPIYDLHPLNRAGMIEILLRKKGFSQRDLQIRLALGCLATLQREISPGGPDNAYRTHVVGLLTKALDSI
jgi:aminoglycoside phosphotransferase